MNVTILFKEAVFDEYATRVMGEAFDRACFTLREFGQNNLVQAIMSKRIIDVAKMGERDPDRLYEQALKAFAPKPAKTSAAPAKAALQPQMKSHA